MEKSAFTTEYAVLLELLREIRGKAKITQVELAEKVGSTQSRISKFERGELRLDILQLRTMCHALGTTLPEFVADLEKRLKSARK